VDTLYSQHTPLPCLTLSRVSVLNGCIVFNAFFKVSMQNDLVNATSVAMEMCFDE
jgi:hypothetical protein